MSNQSQQSSGNDDQLFKNMDEQERIYAPEQVPSAQLPGVEADQASTVGGGARATEDGTAVAGFDRVVGDDNDVHPVVFPAVVGYTGTTDMPAVPIVPTANDANEGPDRR